MESPSNAEVRERIVALLAQSERQTVAEIAKALRLPITVVTSNVGFLTRCDEVIKEPGTVKKLPVYRLPCAEERAAKTGSLPPESPALPSKSQKRGSYNDRFWEAYLRRGPIPEP